MKRIRRAAARKRDVAERGGERRHWSLKVPTEVLGTGHMRGEECDGLSEIREGQSDGFRRIEKGREDGFIRNPKRKRCQRLDVSNEAPMRR